MTTVEYVDLTPTWEGIVMGLCNVLRHSENTDSILAIESQFRAMARGADKWNEYVKQRRSLPCCATMDCTNTELTPGSVYCDDCNGRMADTLGPCGCIDYHYGDCPTRDANTYAGDYDPRDAEDFWLDNSDLDEEDYS